MVIHGWAARPRRRLAAIWGLLPLLQLAVAKVQLNLLQWNPHWQCFDWNQYNCSEHVETRVSQMLPEFDIDFANLIEFDDDNFTVPEGWAAIESRCGVDRVSLVYNDERWRPTSGNGTRQVGCMVAGDRPFVVQAFESVNGTILTGRNASNATDAVIVIGAHFPHPASMGMSLTEDLVATLRRALQTVISLTGEKRVILIADTNEYTRTPSRAIRNYLGMPGDKTISTPLERTCCWDNDFQDWGGFDRIIANFGVGMESEVLMEEPLPFWVEQQAPDGRKGAFHKPLKGSLIVHGKMTGPSRTGHRSIAVFITVLVLVPLLVVAGLVVWSNRGFRMRSRGETVCIGDLEDASSESDCSHSDRQE